MREIVSRLSCKKQLQHVLHFVKIECGPTYNKVVHIYNKLIYLLAASYPMHPLVMCIPASEGFPPADLNRSVTASSVVIFQKQARSLAVSTANFHRHPYPTPRPYRDRWQFRFPIDHAVDSWLEMDNSRTP